MSGGIGKNELSTNDTTAKKYLELLLASKFKHFMVLI